MTKLKIDLNYGILEVEGEETFVKEVYQDYKKELFDKSNFIPKPNPDQSSKVSASIPTKRKEKIKNKGSLKRKESYSHVKDIDLSGKGETKDLRDFFKEKAPSVALEKNTVFVYYLQKELKVEQITADHIYTCYKYVNERVPGALRQSLLDTSSKKGLIDTSSMSDIKIPTAGENFVEKDLPTKNNNKTREK